jgi:hypothetical protein
MSEVAASTEVEEETKTEVTEAESTEKVETKTEEKKEPRNYSQEEVDKILAKVRKNERYRTKKEVEAYYRGLTEAQKQTLSAEVKKEEKEDREPVRGDFESYEAFIEARADYRARKAVSEERSKAEKAAKEKEVTESRQKKAGDFQKKVREKFPDIDERIEEVGDMPMYVGVQDAIAESDLGPEIFNELLNNPKEFDRLAAMSESAAIREIGKLEARLEAKSPKAEVKKETKAASKAPAPITPPGGSSGSSDDMPSDKDDTATWMRKENARLAKQRA